MASNIVEIALASEDNYFCGLLVTATSIAKFASRDCCLSYTIIDTGIANENYDIFRRIVRGIHERCTFRRIRISSDDLKGLPDWHGNKTTFARLLLPQILPADVSHVIYSDVDFLWMCDVAELWRLRDDTSPYISARDVNEYVKGFERRWYQAIGVQVDMTRYFCAGLSFFNLSLFRQEELARQTIDFILKHPDVGSADQTALNAVLGGRHRLVEQKWQIFARDSPVEDIKPPCALHYAGEPPWKFSYKSHMLTDVQLLWFRFDASIRGISVWQSLRRHYGPVRIVLWRVIFLIVMGLPPLRAMFNAFLRATGRWGFCELMSRAQFKAMMRFLRF